ncbi:outer membrane receptor for ferrienterochelin and colicins [Paucibacter oligotrophus]|uniref:Outer membrane receptor for ferrienterochelin and colicins n=1 Tax=Roseateles oligotrophus TaxID=1769250 RepID=A0A840L354_9BURK|nr:TonB-dependent receptor [Roseateles oligotrophus]MBB4842660.1 outer membrane receptor for ferrienterochelin and colicins [Roseateles oligotrophus]
MKSPALPLLTLALCSAFGVQAQETSVLPKVTVQSSQGVMRPGALRSDLVKTETLSETVIERSGATNINEALDKNPGISVQVECSICNVRNVLLNNLPGRYTTLLIDGVPIYSSVSSAYGLDSINVHGVERIDVARGAGASLIAPEALAGTVNIVSKRPKANETALRLQLGNFGSRQGDAFVARAFDGGALTATLNYNKHDAVDGDGNGISEYTGFDRKMGGLGFFVDDVGGFKLRGRLDLVNEKRSGGVLGDDYAAIKASVKGNPFDWSKGAQGSPSKAGWIKPADGSLLAYDDGRGGFSEIIFTDRVQFLGTAEKQFGDSRLRLAFGAAQHKQDSYYELSTYIGEQKQYYGEASWQTLVGEWTLTGGANYRFEDLKSHGSTADGSPVIGIDDYKYKTPAVFAQAYRTFFDDALELNASVRYDRHNIFGGISSPRINALYHHTPQLSSRFSAGRGFRAPTSFFEQDHGILDTLYIVREIDRPEISTNFSYALSHASDRLAVTGSYNYNRISNFALLDSGQVDASGRPYTLFTSADKPVTVQGLDVNMSYLLTPALTVAAAGELFHYKFPPGTLVFARPQAKAYLSMDYEQGPLDITAKLVWTGPMNLRKFHADDSGVQERYNFDGSRKRDKSPGFVTLDVRGEYAVSKIVSLYAGADNLTDYKQSDKESSLFVDAEGAPDVTHLWGPNRGRYVYAGVKLSF